MTREETSAAQLCAVAASNEAAAAREDGWAMLAPFGDSTNFGYGRKPDGSTEKLEIIQRFDRVAAANIVEKFKSFWGKLQRGFSKGLPIYDGHPDHPDKNKGASYPSRTEKGLITEMEVREAGLFGKPVFNAEGERLLAEKKGLGFSVNWQLDILGRDKEGRTLTRPTEITSAGLTTNPNLAVTAINETAPEGAAGSKTTNGSNMNKTLIISWLAAQRVAVPETADDAALLAGMDQVAQRQITAANEKSTMATQLQTATQRVTELTTQAEAAKLEAANEKTARVEAELTLAIETGRITAAEKPDWERRLKLDAVNEAAALRKLTPKMKLAPATRLAGRKEGAAPVQAANEASTRQAQFNDLIAEKQRKTGMNRVDAYNACMRENPDFFTAATT